LRGCEAGGAFCAWCGHGTGRRLGRTGKSAPVLEPATRAGGRYDNKPKRRLFEMLKSQGMQMNQAVTFLSDGGDTVRDLQMYLNPKAEHLLDWFHISTRGDGNEPVGQEQATPGYHHIDDQIAEGDKVVTRMTSYGKHEGDLPGAPRTGHDLKMTSITIHRIAGGKLVEKWSEKDGLGFLIQIGVMRPPGVARRRSGPGFQ
jgi:hypothetical protein